MAEKLTSLTSVALNDLARNFQMWIAKMDESPGDRDRVVDLATLAAYFSGGAIAVEQTSHGFAVGDAVRHDGTSYAEATADSEVNARVSGVVVEVIDADNFWLQGAGYASTFSGLTAGDRYYLQDAGGYGTTAGTVEVPLFDAVSATEAWLIALGGAGGASTSGVLEFTVRNDTGSTITAGTLVEVHDATASQIRVRPADKDTSVSADGIAIENIASNSEGDIRVGGTYSGVDTSGLTEGDPIWLGDDGAFVDSAPTSGAVIRVGKVGIVAADGSIALRLPAFEAQASETAYDNASSGLTADDVQAALDEVAGATIKDDFTDLDDTPASYSGLGGEYVRVKTDESGLETGTPSGAGDMSKSTYDTDDDGIVDAAHRVEKEAVTTTGSSGTTHDIDWSTPVHQVTLDDDCTVSFTNVPSDGNAITVEVVQDGTGGHAITWPGAVTWAGGSAPSLTTDANAVDVFTFYTPDGGTTVRGFQAGADFS